MDIKIKIPEKAMKKCVQLQNEKQIENQSITGKSYTFRIRMSIKIFFLKKNQIV